MKGSLVKLMVRKIFEWESQKPQKKKKKKKTKKQKKKQKRKKKRKEAHVCIILYHWVCVY